MHTAINLSKPPTHRALSAVPDQEPPRPHQQRWGGQNNFQSNPDIPKGVWATHIQGRYRHFSIHQLVLYWSCYKSSLISYRQLRILFAASEMLERRNYSIAPDNPRDEPRKPLYTLDELKLLIDGRAVGNGSGRAGGWSASADTALRADLKHLARLGLLSFTDHELDLATSVDQLRVERSGGGDQAGVSNDTEFFWTMFNKLDHKRRPVPVPRRIVRAIAGHFNPGTTAVALATLVRGMFWRKELPDHARTLFDHTQSTESGGGVDAGSWNKNHTHSSFPPPNQQQGGVGGFRIDNRTKREWIVDVFGISARTVTNGRTTLIELGWLIPLETPQWLRNRYGTHDAINPDWEMPKLQNESAPNQGESASPSSDFSGKIASPDLNQNSSPTGNSKTRRPAPSRAGTAGVSLSSTGSRKQGSRKERGGGYSEFRIGHNNHAGSGTDERWGRCGGSARPSTPLRRKKPGSRSNSHTTTILSNPNIRDIQPQDLSDTGRLLALHAQAVKIGLAKPSESGRLDFIALAQRARKHGNRGGALFFYLLREQKTGFITQESEDDASRMLKEHLFGLHKRTQQIERRPQECGGDRVVQGRGSRKEENRRGVVSDEKSGGVDAHGRPQYSKDEQVVIACMRLAQKHRIGDGFRIAHKEGWTRQRWDDAVEQYEATKFAIRRWELMDGLED